MTGFQPVTNGVLNLLRSRGDWPSACHPLYQATSREVSKTKERPLSKALPIATVDDRLKPVTDMQIATKYVVKLRKYIQITA
mgnify:CR=1 FL=1